MQRSIDRSIEHDPVASVECEGSCFSGSKISSKKKTPLTSRILFLHTAVTEEMGMNAPVCYAQSGLPPLFRIHLVIAHLVPFFTGQPPCKEWGSISPSGYTPQNRTASPFLGLYLKDPSSQLRQSVIDRSAPTICNTWKGLREGQQLWLH